MKLKILLYLFCSLFIASSFSQNNLGIQEKNHINQAKEDAILSFIIKGNISNIKTACRKHDGNLKYYYDNLAAIDIAKENYAEFIATLENVAIEMPISKGTTLMDTALIHNNILQVHQGVAPLTQAYTGEGVVVGILDAGIYFNHDDFKKPNGDTRIRYIWDQNLTMNNINPPLPYNYGEEWSWIDIDNGTCTHIEPSNQFGHGTTVAGIACGDGSALNKYSGVAPNSEIIAVAINFNDNNFLGHVVDGIDYVFKKADALGKPCVINTSIGTYGGSHDGRDLSTQLIEAMISEKEGRAVVAAAGNGNNLNDTDPNYISTHLSYPVTPDTSFTWFETLSIGQVYFSLWADTSDFNQVNFAFGNDDTTSYTFLSSTDFINIEEDFIGDLSTGITVIKQATNTLNGFQGTVEMFAIESEGRYNLEVLITPVNTAHLWRFITTGNGTFDIWSSNAFQGSSNMIDRNLPPNFVLPEIDFYQLPDDKKTIVSSWQCSDKVITVGNFANRAYYFDVDTNIYFTGLTPGEIYYQSSEGPTRDNRLKPDISATGNFILATGNANFIASALTGNRFKVAQGGLHNRNGGTSSASPVVAGVVALYLEKNPNAYWYETKEAIIQTVKRDNFTGTSENTQYGHGKVNGFEALQFNAIVGCTDNTSFNYNANANVDDESCEPIMMGCTNIIALNYDATANTDDGSCILPIYGCMDTTALNYDTLANVSNDSCVYDTMQVGVHNIQENLFSITPNPAAEYVTIKFNYSIGKSEIIIFDILGKEIYRSMSSNHIQVKNWDKGIYFIQVTDLKSQNSITQKLIVQ